MKKISIEFKISKENYSYTAINFIYKYIKSLAGYDILMLEQQLESENNND